MFVKHHFILILLFISIYFVAAENDTAGRNEWLSGEEDLIKTMCKNTICVKKCCAVGWYVGAGKVCLQDERYTDFSELKIYDKNKKVTGKTVSETFDILPGGFNGQLLKALAFPMEIIGYIPYLEETGTLVYEMPNMYQRWTEVKNANFCIDYRFGDIKANKSIPYFWAVMPPQNVPQSNDILTKATFVSCFFMLLVLIVYALLPELRNLCGMILMAYVASLFMAFLLLAIIQSSRYSPNACVGLTLAIYFCFLASFCWMNVMSYDIWWTFRGYAKARPIHRRGENFKFMMYCLYAWGLPLLMTIGFGVVNNMDLRHIPSFVKPNVPQNGCFLRGGSQFFYLYVPMLIMITLNWLFYLMTAYNVWRLSRGTAVLANSGARGTPSAHRSQRHRFMVYLKLSIVMGLNWLLEVVSFLLPGFEIWWYISDTYNILIGLAIFLIFVCKKKIWKKLQKRFIAKRAEWNASSKSYSSSDSSSQQETITLQVSPHPRGF